MDLSNNLRGCLKVVYLIPGCSLSGCSQRFSCRSNCLFDTFYRVNLGLLLAHLVWTVYTLVKIKILDAPLKVAIFLALLVLFGIWLGLSIAASVLVGVGYGFFTPWVSTFEAFRHEKETKKFLRSVVDGTWGAIKGSCTVVRDFADLCYHSYLLYLQELRESPDSNEVQTLRLIHVPACIILGLLGLIAEIPLYTSIAIVKSP